MGLFSPRENGKSESQRYIWFDTKDYDENIIIDSSTGSSIKNNTSTWSSTVVLNKKEWRGLNLTITVKNVSPVEQFAPTIRINSGMYHPKWEGAGPDSYFRHVKNYMNHDSYGMRSETVTYLNPSNPSSDRFGNPNAVYGVNWFAPCLAIDNYKNGTVSWGMQMVSVSTNYAYPFRLYGDFDPVTLKAYFRLEGNVSIPGIGVTDKFNPGETRTWNIWLRFEDYNSKISHSGTNSYRKIAALRSYEPYFVWHWSFYKDPSVGTRVSGRVYGITLAGISAPKAYFSPKDNIRRYYLFSTQNKTSLQGRLPLPGQEYVNPETVTGWKQLLDGIVDVDLLKENGYQGVLVINPAGWGNADRGQNPAYFTNLPFNLKSTFSELKSWEKENGIRVFLASDNTLNKVNLGSFDSPAVNFDIDNVSHDQFENDNFLQGGLKAASGVSFLGLPDYVYDSIVSLYFDTWRSSYPSVNMVSGSRITNKAYSYMVPGYLDRYEFLTGDYSKGGRDWFLDLLMNGVDPWVFMPIDQWYLDYGSSVSTNTKYDDYVQKIEQDHHAIAVTIDRIVKKPCLLPNKLKWKEQFSTYSSISVLDGAGSICSYGDLVFAGKKSCTNKEVHYTYTSNIPSSINYDILGWYQSEGFYDLSQGAVFSSVPCVGKTGDHISCSGESLLWLYSEDRLTSLVKTIENNVGYLGRPLGRMIPVDYSGDLWVEWKPYLFNSDGTTTTVGIGNSLEMLSSYKKTNLIASNIGLQPRTIRDWWIWVLDQTEPGWSVGKTVAEQDDYLQKTWCSRWTLWINEIISTFKRLRPDINRVGFFSSVPNYGSWFLQGLDLGVTNPDQPGSSKELELSYWDNWIKTLDFISPSLYLSNSIVDYDAPFLHSDEKRMAADPVQTRLFHLLNIRHYHDVARKANKQLLPFIYNEYTKTTGFINSNISGYIYKSLYTSGAHGVIWRNDVQTHSDAISKMANIQENWYPIVRFIEYSNSISLLDVSPPVFDITEAPNESEGYLARFGKVHVVSLGGEKRRDLIEGFGVQRYNVPISGSVGDVFPENYSKYSIVVIANSIDGTFEFSKNLNKYNDVEVDIINPSLVNTGLPHQVIEDTFEWVNSGMPSHLSQVHHVNVISGGLATERVYPGLLDSTAPSYQSKYIVPCNTDWYDKINSTIDYDVFSDNGNLNLTLPYANVLLYVEELGVVLVGGYGGVLSINIVTKEISKFAIKSDKFLLIKDIKRYQDVIFILDESKLYFYNIVDNKVTADKALGLPRKLHSVISVFGTNLVIGAEDGIYARKVASSTWKKVVSTTSPVNIMSSPDAALAVSDNGECYYSTDGFNWNRVGILNDKVVNKIKKHRSQILFATTTGLYQDGGSFYTGSVSLQLLDILNDVQKSFQASVNDIDSNFEKAVITLSDGRYLVYTDSFTVYTDSKLSALHKVLIINDDIWLFGYNYFRIVSEDFIRKLATGSRL